MGCSEPFGHGHRPPASWEMALAMLCRWSCQTQSLTIPGPENLSLLLLGLLCRAMLGQLCRNAVQGLQLEEGQAEHAPTATAPALLLSAKGASSSVLWRALSCSSVSDFPKEISLHERLPWGQLPVSTRATGKCLPALTFHACDKWSDEIQGKPLWKSLSHSLGKEGQKNSLILLIGCRADRRMCGWMWGMCRDVKKVSRYF